MTHTQPIPSTMRALVAPFAGAPLELRELPVPGPRHGEVLVRMAAAPVNPADLLMLRGEYGRSWAFPFVPGGSSLMVTLMHPLTPPWRKPGSA